MVFFFIEFHHHFLVPISRSIHVQYITHRYVGHTRTSRELLCIECILCYLSVAEITIFFSSKTLLSEKYRGLKLMSIF